MEVLDITPSFFWVNPLFFVRFLGGSATIKNNDRAKLIVIKKKSRPWHQLHHLKPDLQGLQAPTPQQESSE